MWLVCFLFLIVAFTNDVQVKTESLGQEPVRNTLVKTIPLQQKSWKMSFEIYPMEKTSEWSNIVHVTKKSNKNSYGDRNPAVWFAPGSFKLHVCSAVNENKNECVNSGELPTNSFTRVTIHQFFLYNGVYYYEVQLNETKIYSVENRNTRNFTNMKMYVSDPWYEPSKAKIKNLSFQNVFEIVICEHQRKEIKCPRSYDLDIIYAVYGRQYGDIGNCISIARENCTKSRLSIVHQKCKTSSSSCHLYASNGWFGDTCLNIVKYLHVRYKCNHVKANCPAEEIGEQKEKGRYIFPLSEVGSIVPNKCQYGSSNKSDEVFNRKCLMKYSHAIWSNVDLRKCLNKSDTKFQNILSLNETVVCSSTTNKNCITPSQLASKLVEILQQPGVLNFTETSQIIGDVVSKIEKGLRTSNMSGHEIQTGFREIVKVAEIVTEVIDADEEYMSKPVKHGLNEIHRVLDSIASLVSKTLTTGQTLSIEDKNIGFAARNIEIKANITIVSKTNSKGLIECQIKDSSAFTTDLNEQQAMIQLPQENVKNIFNISLYSFCYRKSTFFQTSTEKVDSIILSAAINNMEIKNVQLPISLQFKTHGGVQQTQKECKFWDDTSNAWDNKGVQTIRSENGVVFCQTNHLTNFALVFNIHQNNINPLELKLITWIGCAISLAGLVLSVSSMIIFKKLRQKIVPRLLTGLSLGLMCFLIIFLVGAEATKPRLKCQTIAAFLHYFILNIFLWMLAQSTNLYRTIVIVFNGNISDSTFFKASFLSCTGIPLVVVAVSIWITNGERYGGHDICIVEGSTFYFGVLLPVAVIMVINVIILVFVIYAIQKSMKQKFPSKKQPTHQAIMLLRTVVACSALLGLTWMFGVFAVGSMSEVFQYLFCIFNSLQGFFIFFFFTLTNKDVQSEWKTMLRMKATSTERTTTNS